MTECLLDTGPIVALIDSSEPEHPRVRDLLRAARGLRLVTTGAVVTETFYFVADLPNGPAAFSAFLDVSSVDIRDVFHPAALDAAVGLMAKYSDTPVDFPDATLVWLAEQTGIHRILTLDRRGFSVFRFAKNRRFDLLLDKH